MDDYHAENAASTCQEAIVREHRTSKEISGAALFDGLDSRPENS